jgi:hypothetical protein
MQRSARKRANQSVAATRTLEVACARAELTSAIQGLFDSWNSKADAAYEASLEGRSRFGRWANSGQSPASRHFFLLERPGGLMVTFGMSASRVVERGFNPNNRGWVASVKPVDGGDDGFTRIGVSLAKWSTNEDAMMWNGSRYIEFVDGLVAGLNGRYVSAQVSDKDFRSISRS